MLASSLQFHLPHLLLKHLEWICNISVDNNNTSTARRCSIWHDQQHTVWMLLLPLVLADHQSYLKDSRGRRQSLLKTCWLHCTFCGFGLGGKKCWPRLHASSSGCQSTRTLFPRAHFCHCGHIYYRPRQVVFRCEKRVDFCQRHSRWVWR